MDAQKLIKILQAGRHYKRLKGQSIHSFENKSTVSVIEKGYVKRYLISKDGNLGVQAIYGPGYFFPLTAAFIALIGQYIYEGDETYFYEAMTDVEYYTIDHDMLTIAVEQDPSLYKDILYEAGLRLQSNTQQLENMALKSAYERVAHQLVFLARRFGGESDEGLKILLPLTHQDFGDMLSLSRETISRSMVRLREHDLIVSNGHYIIPALEKLKSIYS